jgi:transposase
MNTTRISLNQAERTQLNGWVRNTSTEQRLAFRARVLLRLADGFSVSACARAEQSTPLTVRKWRERFLMQGMDGLKDAPRSGKPPTYGVQAERRILALLDQAPPEGYARWNGRLLAKALGDVSHDQVWRVLRRHRISLKRRHR